MKVTHLHRIDKYKVVNDTGKCIFVDIEDGKLNIRTASGKDEFVFKNSDPCMVKAIGELLIAANKIDVIL